MTTIRCLLEETACISKHQPGIIQGDKIILYSEWNDLAGAVADRLIEQGVKPGDRVAVFMATDWRLLVIITGVIRAGAIVCPISTRLPRVAVVDQLKQIQSNVIIAYVANNQGNDLAGITVISPDVLLANPDKASKNVPRIDLTTPAMMIFTSGTSGQPRPAVLSYGNLYYNAQGANVNLRIRSNDRWLLNLPMYHVSGIGIMFRCLLGGASVIIPESSETLAQSIMHYKPSHVSIVPAQLSELLQEPEGDQFASVRVFLVGGSSTDAVVLEKARARKWPVYLTYGMTETASQITTMPPDAPPEKRFSTSGKVLRHRTLKIDESGEILIKGPCQFTGYWTNGSIQPVADGEGWFHSGDLGRLDQEGYLTVIGRKDSLIISGGENIQPEEVEKYLLEIEGIQQAVVVAKKHPRFGQRPVAFIKSGTWDDTAWRKVLMGKLPPFKIPDSFIPWPDGQEKTGLKLSRAWFADRANR